jgi:CRISPR-associated protein Cas6
MLPRAGHRVGATAAEAERALSIVDISFPVRGEPIPSDHGVALYETLASALRRSFDVELWGVHPIRGRRVTDARLVLDERSFVQIRLPEAAVPAVEGLPMRGLVVDGVALTLGPSTVRALAPSDVLRAAFVHLPGALEEGDDRVVAALRAEIDAMALEQATETIGVQMRRRSIMRIAGASLIGSPVELSGLAPASSLVIQAQGIGTRRHYGAGLFVAPSLERRR